MTKKTLTFSADKITYDGVDVVAEGVPIEDIINSIEEDDVVEHLDNERLLSAIGYEKAIAWLETMGYITI